MFRRGLYSFRCKIVDAKICFNPVRTLKSKVGSMYSMYTNKETC